MSIPFRKIRPFAYCCLFSLAVHVVCVSAMKMFGRYDFGAAVAPPPAVLVDLGAVAEAGDANACQPARWKAEPSPPVKPAKEAAPVASAPAPKAGAEAESAPIEDREEDSAAAADDESAPAPNSTTAPAPVAQKEPPAVASEKSRPPAKAAPPIARAQGTSGSMLNSLGRALAAREEKLTYLIQMHGLPIGTAELEAKNERGITTITLKTRSNAAISSFFPVDNLVESQHIDGMYILSKVRQREGSYHADETFTINLRTRKVFWFDLNRSKPVATDLPSDDVLDTLSGIYYLRSRQLQVGKTETLHIYDSETYADVPVEVLRREETRLPNLKKVATLVIRPLQQTAGIFRRTGDLLIWMTDDRYKVPVRIETSIALGRVTAELISAETTVHATPQPPSLIR